MLLLMAGCAQGSDEADGAPLGKVLSMLSSLQQLVIGQGEVAQREYAEFAEWCETRARDLGHELSTGKASAAMLKSSAEESAEKIAALTARVEELAESIASDEEDLQKATTIRDTERSRLL